MDDQVSLEQQIAALRHANEQLQAEIARRQQVEEALRRAEWEKRAILDSLNELVIYTDTQMRLLWMNKAAYESVGQSRESLIGQPCYVIWGQRGDPCPGCVVIKAMDSQSTHQGEIETPDGRIWFNQGHAVLDEEGHVSGGIEIALDITERKLAAEALQQANLVIENSPAVLFRWWPVKGWPVEMVSQNVVQFGYTPAELLSGAVLFSEMIHPQDLARLADEVDRYAAGGIDRFQQEYRLLTPGGEVRWVDDRTTVERTADGRIAFYQGILLDITERKRHEEALRAKSEELEGFFTVALDLLCIADTEGYFRRVNPQWAAVLGYERSELEGRRFLDLVHPDDLESTLAVVGKLSSQETVLDFCNRYRCRDGSYRWIEWRSYPAGNIIYAAARDMTGRMEAEDQIRRLNEELEQRVIERTAQLEAANRELEAFSYSVSHDLRAPLRAIDGYTRILTRNYEPHLDAEGQRICGVIRENAQRMGRLIDDLLALSRLGRTELQFSPIDMQDLVNTVWNELTGAPDRARIDFQVDPLPPAVGDPALIRQVWSNLLANAVKFSARRDRAMIRVSGRREGAEHIYLVQDNGAGFCMQYADKLFGVFQRLHDEREYAGVGVGLAIVQRIVQRHGGRVWAQGEIDRGATFYFTLKQA